MSVAVAELSIAVEEQAAAVVEPVPVRQRMYAWLRDRIKDAPEVHLPDLRDEMLSFFGGDLEFLREYFEQTSEGIFYDAVQEYCGRTRKHVRFGDVVLDRASTEKRLAATRPRWQVWLEHAGDRHIRLLAMKHEDLIAAAREREAAGRHDFYLAALWRRLARDVSGDQQVGDVFTPEQIEALSQEVAQRLLKAKGNSVR